MKHSLMNTYHYFCQTLCVSWRKTLEKHLLRFIISSQVIWSCSNLSTPKLCFFPLEIHDALSANKSPSISPSPLPSWVFPQCLLKLAFHSHCYYYSSGPCHLFLKYLQCSNHWPLYFLSLVPLQLDHHYFFSAQPYKVQGSLASILLMSDVRVTYLKSVRIIFSSIYKDPPTTKIVNDYNDTWKTQWVKYKTFFNWWKSLSFSCDSVNILTCRLARDEIY